MKPADNIEEAIKKLRFTTTAETDERILDDALAVLGKFASLGRGRNILPVAGLAAAVIIIAVVIGAVAFIRPGEKPTEEIAKRINLPAVKKVKTVTEVKPAPAATDNLVDTKIENESAPDATAPTKETAAKLEEELNDVIAMFTDGDVNGLVAVLSEGQFESRLAATYFLAQIGDSRAIGALEKMNDEYGGGEPNNVFAAAIKNIKKRSEPNQQKAALAAADKETFEKSPPIEAKEPITRRGIMTDANGQAVRGTVSLETGRKIETDESGAFEIPVPAGGPQDVHIGYAFDTARKIGRSFLCGDEGNDLDIVLEPLGGITGRVVDEANNPARDANVLLCVAASDKIRQCPSGEPYQIKTGADGYFKCEQVPVGLPVRIRVENAANSTETAAQEIQPGKVIDIGDITLKGIEDGRTQSPAITKPSDVNDMNK